MGEKLSIFDFLRPVSYEEFLASAGRIFALYPELESDEAKRACYDHLMATYLKMIGA